MSAIPQKADIGSAKWNVRFGPEADNHFVQSPTHELPLRFDLIRRRQDNVGYPVTGQINTPFSLVADSGLGIPSQGARGFRRIE